MPYNFDKPFEIREGRSRNWFWIEKELWNDPTLTASDKVIYGSIAYFANNKTQEAYPSLTTLAKFSQCSRMQVSRSLKTLQKLGVLVIKRRPGKHNYYTLLKYPSNKLLPVTNKNGTSNNYDPVLVTNKDTNYNNSNKNYLTTSVVNKNKEDTISYKTEIDRIADWVFLRARVQPSITREMFCERVASAIERAGFEAVRELYSQEENAILFLVNIRNL